MTDNSPKSWSADPEHVVFLSKYPVNRTKEPEREGFVYADAPGALMRALTYSLLDVTREFSAYEVTDAWGMLLGRFTPRWIYDPRAIREPATSPENGQ